MQNISCRKAVDLILKKEEQKLTARQRFQLWKHLSVCSLCRIFSKQNQVIISEMKKGSEQNALSEAEKEKLIETALKSVDG